MHLVGKPTDQTVHSQGRVMADRSVLFKYINPNLAFVLAEGKDASSKSFINIWIMEGLVQLFKLYYVLKIVTVSKSTILHCFC